MHSIHHQLQGLYTAGDVLCAVDCVRALPDYRRVLFFNHDAGFNGELFEVMTGLGAEVRRCSVVSPSDLNPGLVAILYYCVGHHDRGREYVRFEKEPPRVTLYAWIHTLGLGAPEGNRRRAFRASRRAVEKEILW